MMREKSPEKRARAGPPSDDPGVRGVLSRLEQRLKTYRLVGFDTEDDTRGNVVSIAFFDGEKYFYTTDTDEAIDYILEYPGPAYFCAHNLEYDINNVFKARNYLYIADMRDNGKLVSVSLKMSKNSFLNSSCFFIRSLAEMGKLVGIPKLEGDVFNPEYVKTDARICWTFMDRIQRTVNTRWNVNMTSTIGSLSMNIFRKHYLKKNISTFNHPDCLRAYYGGRVEMFYKGVPGSRPGVTVPVETVDINSCYPFVMSAFEYPDTDRIERSRIDTHGNGIGEFRIWVPKDLHLGPLPFCQSRAIPWSDSKRLYFPVGELYGWWTYAEIREALTFPGVRILREYQGWGSKTGVRPFMDFCQDIYQGRQSAKVLLKSEPGDVNALFENELLKLIGNNLYGKFSAHRPKSILSRTRWSAYKQRFEGVITERRIGPFWSYDCDKGKPPLTANFAWGIHVTAYARIHLLRLLRAVHESGNTLVYCDTDSVMYFGQKPVNSPAWRFGPGLGELSRETFDLGVFRGAKGYLLCNRVPEEKNTYVIVKSACKGVPSHHALDFVVKGMASFLKPFKLKEAFISAGTIDYKDRDGNLLKEIGANVWHAVEKKMRSLYIKRKGGPVTRPVDAGDISDLERHAYKIDGQLSIEADLSELGILIKKKNPKIDYFSNIVIPPGWVKKTGFSFEKTDHVHKSKKLLWLCKEDLIDLNPGSVWFSGKVVCRDTLKRRSKIDGEPYEILYFKILLNEYQGEFLTGKNVAGINVLLIPGLLEAGDEIFNKDISVTLEKEYIEKQPLEIKLTIS